MNRFSSHAGRSLAAASACALVGLAAPAVARADTTVVPPPVPAGYVTLTDDTSRISIMVPPTWTDIQTASIDLSGTPLPAISASPNIQSFLDTFDTPGVRYIAFPFTPDPNTLITQYGLQGGCSSITSQPYNDTRFIGVVQVGTGCGAGQATWNMVAASMPDQAFTAVVQLQTASAADQVDFDAVMSTFGPASSSPVPTNAPAPTTAPVATAAPVPTVPAPAVPTIPTPTVPATAAPVPGTVAPTPSVAGATSVPAQGVALTDDTGLLTVQVPTTWIYHSTAPTDAGRPLIVAMAQDHDIDYTVPSLIFIGGDYVTDTSIAIGNLGGDAVGCTASPAEPYNDNVFVGHMQTFTQCNGTEAMRVFVVASPPSQSTTVTLMITMPVFDEAALSLILQTFNVTR